MKSEHYDLIAIGSGSGARDAANKAANEYGAKVALIEREHLPAFRLGKLWRFRRSEVLAWCERRENGSRTA